MRGYDEHHENVLFARAVHSNKRGGAVRKSFSKSSGSRKSRELKKRNGKKLRP
jgi:hypothetical protein